MGLSTSYDDFVSQLAGRKVVPVIRELFADGETPVGIYRKLAEGRPGTFLLESAEQGGIWSRYSFVGVASHGVLSDTDNKVVWLDYGLTAKRALGDNAREQSPLTALTKLYKKWASPDIPDAPPLTGGLVGFIGWEAVRELEKLPRGPAADYHLPTQSFMFVSQLVVIDHRMGTVMLIATALNDGFETAKALWQNAQNTIDQMQAALAKPTAAALAQIDLNRVSTPRNRTSKPEFVTAIERSKQYIHEGDVFQVVISQRFEDEVTASPVDVYRILRTLNPSPYMYLLQLEDSAGEPYTIIGSSPEALVKVQDGRVYTHPIAGSRPRGETPEMDAALEAELLADDKERAEHLMLVDLARNDLAKVCQPGSVEVTEFMRVERFSHIMHLVSSVEGDLAAGQDAVAVFRATFPAGTLSGAPKPRALEIIDELEPTQRGVYGGVVGYFGFGGDADLAIAIRTALISGGIARVQAGAGLVADSNPDAEYLESQNKAAAPLRAVAIANAMHRVN